MPLHRYANGLTARVVSPSSKVKEKPTVLFIHGMMAGAWQFQQAQHWFAQRGYPSVALNLRGHHGSRPVRDLGRVSVRDYVDDALYVAAAMDRPIVIGQSMGGLIAQKLAELNAVRAAALVCSLPPGGIRWDTAHGWIASTYSRLPKAAIALAAQPSLARLIELLRSDLPIALETVNNLRETLSSKPLIPRQRDLNDLIFNTISEPLRSELFALQVPESGRATSEIAAGRIRVNARDVRCPMVSVVCEKDRLVIPEVGQALADKYKGDLLSYPHRGHYGFVAETGWEDIAEGIVQWLRAKQHGQ